MSSNYPKLIIPYRAEGTIPPRRLVMFGSSEDSVTLYQLGSKKTIIGVSGALPAEDGDTVDITRAGIAPVEYGQSIKKGDCLTAGSLGLATRQLDPGMFCIVGIAEVDGEPYDIGSVFVAPVNTIEVTP